MNWLITGGCGFIGTNLIKHLIAENQAHCIRVLDNLNVGTIEDLSEVCEVWRNDSADDAKPWSVAEGVELVVGNILDYDACLLSCEGINIIVHLAASTGVPQSVSDPRIDMQNNVVGTFNMLEAARIKGVERFIFASSGAPIGEVEPPIHEKLAPRPVSPYGAGKLAGEGYCSSYYRTFDLQTVSLRFGNVYGPRSKHKSSVVAKFIKQALNGETLEIYGDGHQTRDYIFIGDLIQAIELAALTDGIGGEIFQIATNTETTVQELSDILVQLLLEKGIDSLQVAHAGLRLGDVRRNFSDTTKARKILNWKAKTDLTHGLLKTIEWFMECEPQERLARKLDVWEGHLSGNS